MGTRYLARLQFEAGGPAVQGEWSVPGTAADRYTEWVGLYGTNAQTPHVVIRLVEEVDGTEHVRKTWTAEGQVQGPPT